MFKGSGVSSPRFSGLPLYRGPGPHPQVTEYKMINKALVILACVVVYVHPSCIVYCLYTGAVRSRSWKRCTTSMRLIPIIKAKKEIQNSPESQSYFSLYTGGLTTHRYILTQTRTHHLFQKETSFFRHSHLANTTGLLSLPLPPYLQCLLWMCILSSVCGTVLQTQPRGLIKADGYHEEDTSPSV